MKAIRISIRTNGEKAYSITHLIKDQIEKVKNLQEAMVFLYCPHTSCGLCIHESYDPLATKDLEGFLKHLAPRDLSFIRHTDEGPDDSPSHMKTLLSGSSLSIPLEAGELCLGTWQGISLLEFRDAPKARQVIIKILVD